MEKEWKFSSPSVKRLVVTTADPGGGLWGPAEWPPRRLTDQVPQNPLLSEHRCLRDNRGGSHVH